MDSLPPLTYGDPTPADQVNAVTSARGLTTQAAPALAYSAEEPATAVIARGRPWWLALVCAAVLVCGGVGGAWAVGHTRRHLIASTPPPPVVVQPVPPPVVAAPPPDDRDTRFLAMLQRDGVRKPVSVPDAVAAAGDICVLVRQGADYGYIESFMEAPRGVYTHAEAGAFLADALTAYCPHAGAEGHER